MQRLHYSSLLYTASLCGSVDNLFSQLMLECVSRIYLIAIKNNAQLLSCFNMPVIHYRVNKNPSLILILKQLDHTVQSSLISTLTLFFHLRLSLLSCDGLLPVQPNPRYKLCRCHSTAKRYPWQRLAIPRINPLLCIVNGKQTSPR
jgi:hypothetical protein